MSLEFENKIALDLIQALSFSISSNMRAISFTCTGDKVDVYFVLGQSSEIDDEEIIDITCDFEALQDGPIDINCHVEVFTKDIVFGSLKGRILYASKQN
ncbi:hypothetical protein J8M20_02155 [Pseudoalteromonas luteoviolacea]|uniref:hypothetical protein n=1 Tax=Pseudoalteromonas luteoviolacea TaxID=43657 RepID=UPI001B3692FC|nr:hypothetical protein [Pseudoalteromonas luteoviolacea]MBQ4810115.1 hypothetical protein [Pseudoalteromonas luteoviolacea]